MIPSEYDGFYFLPGDEDNELCFSFFEFEGKLAGSKKLKVITQLVMFGILLSLPKMKKVNLCLMIRLRQFWVTPKCT